MSEYGKYNPMELMICLAARFLEDRRTVVVRNGRSLRGGNVRRDSRTESHSVL